MVNDAATQLQKLIPEESSLGHFSDDVFSVILRNVDRAKVEQFINSVNEFFDQYLAEIQGRTIAIEFVIGVVLVNDSTESPQDVVMQAVSMTSQISPGAKPNYNFYVPEQTGEVDDVDSQISAQLQQAIESGLFKVLFQPIISLRSQNQPKTSHQDLSLRLLLLLQ